MKTKTLFFVVFVCILSACSSSTIDQCEQANVGVRYVITGEEAGIVSVTQSSDTGGMELGDFAVPYCRLMSGFDEGDSLYISVQINGDSGSVTCKIYNEDKLVSQSTAKARERSLAAIATCSATK
jgi:hypothetical protein